jgi:protein dithiol:quinone oxidoreductase
MPLPSIRLTFFIIALGTLGLMITGFYMQYVMQLIPCPLCITQRLFIVAVGVTALIAGIHNSRRRGVRSLYALLGGLFAVVGGSVSSRQLWLQNLPKDQVPACGPDLTYMFENFPLQDAIEILFRGDGNCAEVTWTFLGLSIAGWTLVAFIGLLGLNLWQALRKQ